MSIAKFSVRNSVLINLLMILAFVIGIFAMVVIPKEDAPPVDFGRAYIVISYPGVSPADMETLVAEKLEDEIIDVDGVDYVTTTIQTGYVVSMVTFETDVNTDDAWDEINEAVNKVTDLPEDANDPIVIRLKMREVNDICNVSMASPYQDKTTNSLAEDLKDKLKKVNNVSKVEQYGDREDKVFIDVDPDKLSAYGLSLASITSAITYRNLNSPGGDVDFGSSERSLRTVGEYRTVAEIKQQIVKTDDRGRSIRLGDIADVYYGFDDLDVVTRLDGKSSVFFQVFKKATGNIITVMKDIHQLTSEFEKNNPGVEVTINNDDSKDVEANIKTLGTSTALGIILVFFTLLLFLGWKNALFAGLGIPFSFLLCFFIMYTSDISMNNLSLFALILVLGMIVDDAIVVIENVHRHMEMGKSPEQAAIDGANEVTYPVMAAVATTAAAFLPMLMMKGMMGKFLSTFPIVVSIALFCSLIECLMILPSHLADFSKQITVKKPHKIHDKMVEVYHRIIIKFLRHRFKVIGSVFLLLIISFWLLLGGVVKSQFFPSSPSTTMVLTFKTPIGTSLDDTEEISGKIEKYILKNMPQKEDVLSVVSYVGMITENHRSTIRTYYATINIDLPDPDDAQYEQSQIKGSIREYLKTIPEVVFVEFGESSDGPPVGDDVSLRIVGDDLQKLAAISEYVQTVLEGIPGVEDTKDDLDFTKKQVEIFPYHNKLAENGFTVSDISSAVWTAVNGRDISTYRGEEVDDCDITLRLDPDKIDNLEKLKDFKLLSSSGDLIPLRSLAEFKINLGIGQIKHRNGDRIVTINASCGSYEKDGKKLERLPSEVTAKLTGNKLTGEKGILSDFSSKFPGYSLEFGGMAERQKESYDSLILAFIVAIIIIYTILAWQFKSYVQPFLVMMSLLFAFIGVILGLVITNLPFSLPTFIGVVGLAGVVVNDSLVLVDFVNRLREEGHDRWSSLIEAGKIRLRPIFLTTFTTIAGFLPMILSTSSASADWKPIAVTMAFGLAFATLLTLLVLPCMYSIVDSIFGYLKITRFQEHITLSEALQRMGE